MAVNLEPDRALLTDGTVVAVRELGASDTDGST